MTHDQILITVVGVIILIQVFVFFRNVNKINTYSKTLQKVSRFSIVKAKIREEEIASIPVDDILLNPENYQGNDYDISEPEENTGSTESIDGSSLEGVLDQYTNPTGTQYSLMDDPGAEIEDEGNEDKEDSGTSSKVSA